MSTLVFAYLDRTDTVSKPFEDPINTETPESPLAIAPPVPLSESTPPVLVPILHRTARMAVRVPHAMSSSPSASLAEVAAMSESALRKRFQSSYESSPSVSPPDLPLRKRYRGTSELVEDSEEDDEEIEESADSYSVSEDAKDEGPTAKDEDPTAEDEGLTVLVEGSGMDDDSYGLDDEGHGRDDESRGIDDEGHSVESDRLGLEEEKEAVLEDPEDSMIYIDIPDYPPPAPPVQTPPSPEWTSGLLPISSSHFDVPSPVSSPIIPLIVPPPVAIPTTVVAKGFLTELGAQVEMQGGLIRDYAVRLEELSPALFERYDRDIRELFIRSGAVREEIFSQRYRFRNLEYEQERVIVTFGVIWRPVLALEAWAGQMDA
ncbi:hypothetical protein Tco_0408585 [Tanacetum coccineum]